ncbi:aspartate kinase [Balneola vulgaris]|uniref:aspartate kinase n=1 Tax=Balneola vulgaris TaxID=287535 RepID=UPI00037C11A4|nr:aspartate kinase [Balneola vulgaris]
MDIHVLKFGGTSMNDHQTWKKVLEIIKSYEHPIVVVSATAKTTRQLIEAGELAGSGNLDAAREISASIHQRHLDLVKNFLDENPHAKNALILESCTLKLEQKIGFLNKLLSYCHKLNDLTPSLKDAIAAVGEQISSYLLAQCGLATDQLTQFVDAKKVIKTDLTYGNAKPNLGLINQKIESLITIMEGGFTPIIGGFYGEAQDGTTTTLGFEGSDYSASLIGGAVHATTIEIWTDVSGVFTSDPRYIKNATPLAELSYFDATEMAYFGSKVLHPSTLKPAQERNIPVLVKNMFKPEDTGTKIIRDSISDRDALAISFKDNMALLTISAYETVMGYNFLRKVFKVLEDHKITVDAVNTTEASVTIALTNSLDLDEFTKAFIEVGQVSVQNSKGLISIIGCNLSQSTDLTNSIFKPLKALPLDMISFSKEKRIINMVVNEDEMITSAQAIHDTLFG